MDQAKFLASVEHSRYCFPVARGCCLQVRVGQLIFLVGVTGGLKKELASTQKKSYVQKKVMVGEKSFGAAAFGDFRFCV